MSPFDIINLVDKIAAAYVSKRKLCIEYGYWSRKRWDNWRPGSLL